MTTLANLRVKVSRRLEDTSNSHWSTTEIDDLVNESLMDIWQTIRRVNPHVLPLKNKTFDWAADTRSVSLDGGSYINAANFDIYLVSMTSTTDDISSTNLPAPLPRIPYEEINRSGVATGLFHENTTHYGANNYSYRGIDAVDGIPSTWGPGGHTAIYAWALQGHELFISPVPRTEIQVQIEYIVPFVTATSDNQVFDDDNAMFRPFEPLVELGAVLAAKGRSDEATDPVLAQWQYKMDLFLQWLERREVTGTPTVILNGY